MLVLAQSMCLFAGYDAGRETRELSTATVNPVKIEVSASALSVSI